MNEQNSKVALVTGGSRGIGAAIARRLAADGFTVVVNYAGNAQAAESVVRHIEAAGGRAVSAQGDVAVPADARRLFDTAESVFGGVDVLVNNAGVLTLTPIADFDDDAFDRLFAINVKGSYNMMREAGRRLRNGGRVINFSTSVVGLLIPTYGPYVAAKAAIEATTMVFARELRGRDITVNAVAPGPTATELFLDGKSQERIDELAKMPPLQRLGTPDDIAGVVSFLAGPDGAWVNGQVIRANGGIV